jgi:putative oxygen-independent coproporphyrinogen III oxidase
LPARPYGVYVHFPWCTFRCPYCDFAVTTARREPGDRYARAVVEEIRRRAPGFASLACATLFLGGGTPSLWEPEGIARVVAAVRALGLPAGAEVTLEANPESVTAGRAAAWRAAGVNRLSIGVQSFDAAVLRKLGRRHGPEEAERAVREGARAIPNLSVDLIHGARRSSPDTARSDAARAASLPVTHVSAYALTLEGEVLAEEVPFARLARQGKLRFPGEDEVLAQGEALRDELTRRGLRRYEVSNFARPGFESRHNLLYWRSGSYLGVGVGAVGCLHGRPPGRATPGTAVRWWNHRGVAAWYADLDAGRLPTAEEERLDAPALRNERLMLALRTAEGLEAALLSPSQRAEAGRLAAAGLATLRRGRLALTARGLDVHSAVAGRLFE